MDILTLFGLSLGLGVVFYVMQQGEITALLFNLNAFLLVFGGTFASTMITYPWNILKRVPRAVFFIVTPPKLKKTNQLIEQIVNLQALAYANGIDSLSDEVGKINDKFISTGIRMIIEDQSVESIKENLNNEIIVAYSR